MLLLKGSATPTQVVRAVVLSVSGSSGSVVQVAVNGGSTAVPAFAYEHITGLTAGQVVEVLVVGTTVRVLGAFPTGT
jgi:hypothetical protein